MRVFFLTLLAAIAIGLTVSPAPLEAQCATCASAEGIPDHCVFGPYANSFARCRYTPLFGCEVSGCCEGSGCQTRGTEGLSLAGSVITADHLQMFGEQSARNCTGAIAVVATVDLAENASSRASDVLIL